jgi:SAM-dependent methyltransferase
MKAKVSKRFWERTYRGKDPTRDVSWYQSHPTISLKMIQDTGIGKHEPIIDVGGGASFLVDSLLEAGFDDLTVLDISGSALAYAQARLGLASKSIAWLEADVTAFECDRQFALWHDRAVFHFFIDIDVRRKYVQVLKRALKDDGHLIMAAFAEDGPPRCTGLPVCRYSPGLLCAELGEEFVLLEHRPEIHTTPWDTKQRFAWFRFQRKCVPPNAPTARQQPEMALASFDI